MAETHISTDHPAVKADSEFQVTGIGYYLTREHEIAYVREYTHAADSKGYSSVCWGVMPSVEKQWSFSWYQNGRVSHQTENKCDLVAGPYKTPSEAARSKDTLVGPVLATAALHADKTELAGLEDYVCFRAGYNSVETSYPDAYGPEWTIIDLSTITKDQLVQPKPEPKTVKQTILLAVRKNGTVFTVGDRDSFRPCKNHLDAIIEHEIEIEYTPGEGLGEES